MNKNALLLSYYGVWLMLCKVLISKDLRMEAGRAAVSA
jgi:hypothetical protein